MLIDVIDKKHFGLLRTIVEGVPHWIICVGYKNNNFTIYDPWNGIYDLTEYELDDIWEPRNYEFFEIKK